MRRHKPPVPVSRSPALECFDRVTTAARSLSQGSPQMCLPPTDCSFKLGGHVGRCSVWLRGIGRQTAVATLLHCHLLPHLASELGGGFERRRPTLRTERAAWCRRGGIELCATVCRAVYSAPSALPIVSTASRCVCLCVCGAGRMARWERNARREERCLGPLVSYRVFTVCVRRKRILLHRVIAPSSGR